METENKMPRTVIFEPNSVHHLNKQIKLSKQNLINKKSVPLGKDKTKKIIMAINVTR